MTPASAPVLRELFLRTRTSARGRMAEALMTPKTERLAPGRFEVGSTGADPADAVHPLALEALSEFGTDWSAGRPKDIQSVCNRPGDLISQALALETRAQHIAEDVPVPNHEQR